MRLAILITLSLLFFVIYACNAQGDLYYCPPGHELSRIKINHDYHCETFLTENDSVRYRTEHIIWQPNDLSFEVEAWRCQAVTVIHRSRCPAWFASEDETKTLQWNELVSPSECFTANTTGHTKWGTISEKTDQVRITSNIEEIPDTSCWRTDKWYSSKPITNFVLSKTFIKHQNGKHLTSPAGSMATCDDFKQGYCVLSDNSTMIWKSKSILEENFLPLEIITTERHGSLNVEISGKTAFVNGTKIAVRPWLGCSKEQENLPYKLKGCDLNYEYEIPGSYTIYSSPQHQLYTPVRSKEAPKPKKQEVIEYELLKSAEVLEKSVKGRYKREQYVRPEWITGLIQAAISLSSEEVLNGAKSLGHSICEKMERDSRMILACANNERAATLLARIILKREDISATIHGDYLNIRQCIVIKPDDYEIQPMNGTYFEDIPILMEVPKIGTFTSDSKLVKRSLFFDASTLVVRVRSSEIPKEEIGDIIINFKHPVVYIPATGHINHVNFQDTHIYNLLKYNQNLNFTVPLPFSIDWELLHKDVTIDDVRTYSEKIKSVMDNIQRKASNDHVSGDVDPQKIINGILSGSFFNLFVPDFNNSPFLRLWIILVLLWVTCSVVSQYILPPIIKTYLAPYMGFGNIIETLYKSKKEQRAILAREHHDPLLET